MKREDRLCKECTRIEVEDVTHWLLRCVQHGTAIDSQTEDAEDTAHLLSLACRNYIILSTIMSMWCARFGKSKLRPCVLFSSLSPSCSSHNGTMLFPASYGTDKLLINWLSTCFLCVGLSATLDRSES